MKDTTVFVSFSASAATMHRPASASSRPAVTGERRARLSPSSLFHPTFRNVAETLFSSVFPAVPSRRRLSPRRSRKEVFQPHLPVRLPCYDLAPVTSFALGRSSRLRTSGAPGFHGLTGGVYKARERIHRAMADARLLANPASRSRVADSDPN